jgi:hypothetical protein
MGMTCSTRSCSLKRLPVLDVLLLAMSLAFRFPPSSPSVR